MQGTICLRISRMSDNQLKFIVKDTGLGIDSDKLDQLFTLFYRESSASINAQGCGMGLYLSNQLTQKLGGSRIQVHSVLNQGSEFSFYLKISEEVSNQPQSDTVPSLGSSESDCLDELSAVKTSNYISTSKPSFKKEAEGSEILIVDDNDFNRGILTYTLKEAGYSYKEACNGKQALDMITQSGSQGGFKLVIMDLNMPVMDGFTATLEICKLISTHKISHLPAIVGYSANNEDKDTCRRYGMVDFLKKPAPKQEVLRLVNRFTLN